MTMNIVTELAYFFNFAFGERANFEPVVAFIFTMDFFIISLNVSKHWAANVKETKRVTFLMSTFLADILFDMCCVTISIIYGLRARQQSRINCKYLCIFRVFYDNKRCRFKFHDRFLSSNFRIKIFAEFQIFSLKLHE